jgi:hypothetical protein
MLFLLIQLCSAVIDFSSLPSLGIPPSQRIYSVMSFSCNSSSSISGYTSSIFTTLNAESNFVFISAISSVFYFSMTPSLFQSQSSNWPAQETGHQVYECDYLSVVDQLQFTVSLIESITVLNAIRSEVQTLMLLFSSLIGSVFGIMGSVGQAMNVVEGYMIGKKNKMDQKRALIVLKKNRERIDKQINDSEDKMLEDKK